MATHKDFEADFSALPQDSFERWTIEDLQLAAELGKALLERNKELESNVKEYQRMYDDQAKEIEYLRKQAAALRKVNDDRIQIYEQLEVSIQELERANKKLALDNSADKKQIKSLCAYRDALELKYEDLQKALDEARDQQKSQKEQIWNLLTRKNKEETVESREVKKDDATVINQEDFEHLTKQNEKLKNQSSKNQRKIANLEEEMSRKIQDMALLTEELREREIIVNSLRSKMSILEDEKSYNFCYRCCKELDIDKSQPTLFLVDEQLSRDIPQDNKEDSSYGNFVGNQCEEQPSYSILNSENHLSLKDELRSCNYNIDFEEFSKEKRKEEETSSGFSELQQTYDKSTQTEKNAIPGSFLCSIADGDDCKFSIYDDACPVESRFRKIPHYRTLFREIFTVLKRAAEAKNSGQQLPSLDDLTPLSETFKVPPVTPVTETPPLDFDDPQSLASGSSIPTKDISKTDHSLQYLSIEVKIKSADSAARKIPKETDSVSPNSPNSPRKPGGRRRKNWRNYDSFRTQSPGVQPHILTTLAKSDSFRDSPCKETSSWSFQPLVSTAAQEVAKLKTLERSYAEALKELKRTKYFPPFSNLKN